MELKISKWLEIIAFKTRQKSLYFELKYYIKNNKSYFRRIHYWERGMGKTHTLVELAKKFKCPIIVKNESSVEYMKRMYNIKNINIISCNNSIRGKKFDKVLFEEGIDIDIINEVLAPTCNCLVGYIDFDTYSNKKFIQEYECDWIK